MEQGQQKYACCSRQVQSPETTSWLWSTVYSEEASLLCQGEKGQDGGFPPCSTVQILLLLTGSVPCPLPMLSFHRGDMQCSSIRVGFPKCMVSAVPHLLPAPPVPSQAKEQACNIRHTAFSSNTASSTQRSQQHSPQKKKKIRTASSAAPHSTRTAENSITGFSLRFWGGCFSLHQLLSPSTILPTQPTNSPIS